MGFKLLGSTGWVRSAEGEHHVVAVQASQSGWDPHSGNRFVVEFERSERPVRATGFSRQRIWGLLDEISRREALRINDHVAETLPPPNQQILRELPPELRPHYLAHFERDTRPVDATRDVWFAYYDEDDASAWATFLGKNVPLAFATFLREPPSLLGHREG